jgi:hypothetical protein
MRVFVLFIFFIIHWSLAIFTSVYALVRKNKQYDWFYFAVIASVFYGWFFNKNECMISLIEKILMNCNYEAGEDPVTNPSLFIYEKEGSMTLKLMLPIIFALNIILVLREYISNSHVICFIVSFLYSMTVYYHFHYDLRLNK